MRDRIRQWWLWMHTVPSGPRTLAATIAWWERRRIPYNVFLAAVGVPSLLLLYAMVGLADALAPGEDSIEPLALIVAPFLANIAYTAGWIVEGGLLWTRPNPPRGPRLMRFGLIFSLVVILLPVMVWTWRALVP